ncbi:MAG: RNA polymerase sigma factor [Limisphaerales bacterium]
MVITDDCPEQTDTQELLAGARAGDAAAFCRVIEPRQTRLFRQAVVLCRDPTVAEDLVAETLVEAWKSLRHYNETCRLSTWLYAILLHRHQKTLRRARSRPIPLSALPALEAEQREASQQNLAATGPTPAETAADNERAAQLRQWIDALPEKHRQVILLRFFEEASMSDMAAVLHCSVGTVKSRLHHALEKLRKAKVNLSELRRDI